MLAPRLRRRAGRRLGRAGRAGARRDAPVLAAPPPAARRRRRDARDDERATCPTSRSRIVDEDALERLRGIADLFLVHDRPIQTRTDDSVVRVRFRGAHDPPPLPRLRSRRAVAARWRHAATAARLRRRAKEHVLRGSREPGVGQPPHRRPRELRDAPLVHRRDRALRALFAVEPEVVAHDLHPEYLSTKYALDLDGVELIGVQHHHAHLAACLAEHGETGPAIGAIFDGTGYGLDGTVWGGELLSAACARCERVGSLLPVRAPRRRARDQAAVADGVLVVVSRPRRRRAASARLARPAGRTPRLVAGRIAWPRAAARPRRQRRAWGDCSMPSPRSPAFAPRSTTRARRRSSSRPRATLASAVRIRSRSHAADDPLVIDPRETIRAVLADVTAGESAGVDRAPVSPHDRARHRGRVRGARRRSTGREVVVLSGGVFQSRLLLESVSDALAGAGLRVLVPERLPVNDGGIAYGQAAVAAASLA